MTHSDRFEREIFDITIIGSGPSGLMAAFYAGMRKQKVKIIEALAQPGGQPNALYPEKYIYDIAGFEAIKGQDLISRLLKQNEKFQHTFCLDERVEELETLADGTLLLKTQKGEHYSRSVIVAVGAGAFKPRKLDFPQLTAFEGESVHYHISQPQKFAGQKVAICGGGDSAVDWALMLEEHGAEVSLIHRRGNFRAHEHSLDLLEKSDVSILAPAVLEDVEWSSTEAKKLFLKLPEEKLVHSVDHLIVAYGFSSSLAFMKNWGLSTQRNAIEVKSDMSTSMPGVFAAGDICTFDGKVRLITNCFGESTTAVNNAIAWLKEQVVTV